MSKVADDYLPSNDAVVAALAKKASGELETDLVYGTSKVSELLEAAGMFPPPTSDEEKKMNGTFDQDKLKTATTVMLLAATKLYQPVKGTSNGSRYFVLAIGETISVAGRWQPAHGGHSLALRVEGSGLDDEEMKGLIVACGLDFKSSTHASAHLTSDSEVDIRKAVGALLCGLGQHWTTPMPNPSVIKGI